MSVFTIVLSVVLGLSLFANGCLFIMWLLTAETLKQDEKIIKASREVLSEKKSGGE